MSTFENFSMHQFNATQVREESWGSVWKSPDDSESIILQVSPDNPPTVPSWWKYSEDNRFVICLH